MRYLLAVILLVLGVAQSARAQGTVLFANNAQSLVCCGGQPAPVGHYTVGLYAGTSQESLFLRATVPINPVSGRFNGGTVSILGVPGGGTATLQLRFWSTAAGSSYEEAIATGNPSYTAGLSEVWTQSTGNPDGEPPTPPTSIVPGFTGLDMMNPNDPFCPIPEPATPLLALLGGLALLLLRSRRRA